VYSASTAAPHAFARVWLNELKDRRIWVNVLSPGPVETEFIKHLLDGPEVRGFVEGTNPRSELGRPDEVSTVALFLASDDSSLVNGQWLNDRRRRQRNLRKRVTRVRLVSGSPHPLRQ
jgi:NAD(P)-dependent dehydrogenase (short-subunit alcohol dehydrogenase family)